MSDPDLFSIQGFAPNDAQDYIASLTLHANQLDQELVQITEDLNLWTQRAISAEAAGRGDLADQARERIQSLLDRQSPIQAEQAEFQVGLQKLKNDFQALAWTKRSVDPQALLQAIEKVAGPTDHVSPELRRQEAEQALARLKQRLGDHN